MKGLVTMRPPCYDVVLNKDCENRCVGCRSTCIKWQAYETEHLKSLEEKIHKVDPEVEFNIYRSCRTSREHIKHQI